MAEQDKPDAEHQYPPEPGPGDTDAEGRFTNQFDKKVEQFLNSRVFYTDNHRLKRFEMSRLCDYFRASEQWKRKRAQGGAGLTRYEDLTFAQNDPRKIPMPVVNIVEAPLRNEAARLSQPDYQPYVPVSGVNPDVKTREGAKLAVQALEHVLNECNWPFHMSLGTNHMPDYGGWWIKTWFDYNYEETTRVGVLDAVKCPQCDFKLASPTLPASKAQKLGGEAAGLKPLPPKGPGLPVQYQATTCPQCQDHVEERDAPMMGGGPGFPLDTGMEEPAQPVWPPGAEEVGEPANPMEPEGPAEDMGAMPMMGGDSNSGTPRNDGVPAAPPQGVAGPGAVQPPPKIRVRVPGPPALEPFMPVEDELEANDSVGRPLGQDIPLGKPMCETVFDYDMWVEHDGIEVIPGKWGEIAHVHCENIEWARNRYEKAFDVKPEKEDALQKWHPITVDFQFDRNDRTPRRVRIFEFYKEPWRTRVQDPETGEYTIKMNKGRTIHFAHGKILKWGDHIEQSKKTKGLTYPDVEFTYIPFELASGGKEMHGNSMFAGLRRGQESTNKIFSMFEDTLSRMGIPRWLVTKAMSFAWDTSGRAGGRYTWEPDERFPEREPKEIGNTVLNPGVWELTDRYKDNGEEFSGKKEVESGGADPGDPAAAIQLKLENAGAQRSQRHTRVREGLERAWSHLLTLMAEKVTEPRTLWREDNPGQYQERVWSGEDLHGQTRVKITGSPVYQSDVVTMLNMKQAKELGTINPAEPKTARMINRRLHIPDEMIESENRQADLAEREFSDFVELDKEPMLDGLLDNMNEHAERHALDMKSERWIDLEDQAGIYQVWPLLEAWNEPREFVIPQAPPGQGGQPGNGQPMGPPPPWIGTLPPPPPMPAIPGMPPPPPPMPSGPVPMMKQQLADQYPAMDLRVLTYWSLLLMSKGIELKQGTPLWKVLRFRAHLAGTKELAQDKAQQAMAGQATLAAPGAPETMTGMAPGAGANSGPVDPQSIGQGQ